MTKSPGGKKRKPKLNTAKALADAATALEGFSRRLIALESDHLALMAAFVSHEARRGVNQEKLLNDLEAVAKKFETAKYVRIGDRHPVFAEHLDTKGLLKKMLDELT